MKVMCVALAILASACAAPDGVPSQDGAGGATMFTGGRVIVGDGSVIDDGAFLVEGDRFVAVGRAGTIETPPGTETVSLQGQTVMPAMVNAHSHLGWEGYTSWGSANFTRDNLIDHLYRHAYYGVGTVISTGSD